MIKIKAPGRLCLFGEHQDYLGYPVISLAISKYIYLKARKISNPKFIIKLPDINQELEITLNNKELAYESNRDYLRSGYNQFIRKKIKFNSGYRIVIKGDIPINAGVASSSALIIAWLYFLNLISNRNLTPKELALLGYESEVKEFGEAGGMMDHFSSSFGNLIYLQSKNLKPKIAHYNVKLNGFVLGNSLEKKDTVKDLMRVKNLSLKSFEVLKDVMPEFDPVTSKLSEVKPFLESLESKYREKIIGNLINRDLTLEAKKLLNTFQIHLKEKSNLKIDSYLLKEFYKPLGLLLTKHHEQLRDRIKVSIPKIDGMIQSCLDAGALGGKINGSGFGGTIFVLAPGKEKLMKNIINELGGKAFIIHTSDGVKQY